MSHRWSNAEIERYANRRLERHQQERSADGFIKIGTEKRRALHKSKYLFHAAAYCRDLKVKEPVGEHYFHPERDWRFDLAWPEERVALEVDGIWVTNAHTQPMQVVRNMEKQNEAVFMGWKVLRCQENELAKVLKRIAESFLR